MTYKTLSHRIEFLRRERHMSQAEFGRLLGITQATASRKLNGQIPFSTDEVLRCAIVFGVSTEALYGREDLEDLKQPV